MVFGGAEGVVFRGAEGVPPDEWRDLEVVYPRLARIKVMMSRVSSLPPRFR